MRVWATKATSISCSATLGHQLWDLAGMRPSLDLNFAESKSLTDATTGTNLVTFTRAGDGTYVDSDGIIQTATANTPRFDHNPTTGESLGLLVEESRTNLITYSENFNFWGSYRTTVSPNAAISPSGQLNATKLNVTTDTGYHAKTKFFTGGTYIVSIFAKAGEYSGIQIAGSASVNDYACFNLVNGTAYFAGTNVTDEKIENFGNGWYRCSATLSLTNGIIFVAITDGISTSWLPSFAGSSATDGIYIWGAQLEAGSFPTSYIPTTGTALTRSADVASITGSDFSNIYNASEGTLYAEAKGKGQGNTSSNSVFQVDDGSINNRILLINDDESTTNSGVVIGGVATLYTASPSFTTGVNKNTIAYKSGDTGTSLNGSTVITDTPGIPTVNVFRIGSDGFGTSNHTIKRLTYFPERLPDSSLQNMTQ
jgi:hypothetical protein